MQVQSVLSRADIARLGPSLLVDAVQATQTVRSRRHAASRASGLLSAVWIRHLPQNAVFSDILSHAKSNRIL